MIMRCETVPPSLTDDGLLAELAKSPGQKARAELLLTAPSEYRWGIESRVRQSTTIHEVRVSGGMTMTALGWTGVPHGDARRQALAELAAQGVALLPWPRT
jgi:hypothetical protein